MRVALIFNGSRRRSRRRRRWALLIISECSAGHSDAAQFMALSEDIGQLTCHKLNPTEAWDMEHRALAQPTAKRQVIHNAQRGSTSNLSCFGIFQVASNWQDHVSWQATFGSWLPSISQSLRSTIHPLYLSTKFIEFQMRVSPRLRTMLFFGNLT